MGHQPCVFLWDSAGSAHGAHWRDLPDECPDSSTLLASVADVGRVGHLAADLAEAAGPDGRAEAAGLGRSLSGCYVRHREKRGLGVAGKGTKCVVVSFRTGDKGDGLQAPLVLSFAEQEGLSGQVVGSGPVERLPLPRLREASRRPHQ
jgi:hypothetical protein